MTKKVSTTTLAKLRVTDASSLFSELHQYGYIRRHNGKWMLTNLGVKFGGEYVNHSEFGLFIVWPENLLIDTSISSGQNFTATQIGEHVGLNAKKVNQLFSELGWIDKRKDGWHLTDLGVLSGGEQREDKSSSNLYTVWHDTVLKDKNFTLSVVSFTGANSDQQATDRSYSNFQHKFAAKYRASDGHYVRNKGELLIDNWLYMAGVIHAYDRQLPVAEEAVCGFYLPKGKVYLEYWPQELSQQEQIEKEQKLDIYRKYNFNLIELDYKALDSLDQVLPKALRAYGIKAY